MPRARRLNKTRLLAVAAAIRNEEASEKGLLPDFNMRDFADPKNGVDWVDLSPTTIKCNSVCCIGGMACFLYPKIAARAPYGENCENYEDAAAYILGLDNYQTNDLFYGAFREEGQALSTITREQAARAIERLVETGSVL